MTLHHFRRGSGEPLLLVHGLGGSGQSWNPILDGLAARREVVAVDLPGFGKTPPLSGAVSLATLADAVAAFVEEQGLGNVDKVGSSMGASIVLELARRGHGGNTVALDPGGFWSNGELRMFHASLGASIALVRALRPALPTLLNNPVGRTALLAQFSARPWALRREVVLPEVLGLATAPGTGPAFDALTKGSTPAGAPAGTVTGRLTIGWGRRDRVTVAKQAARALLAFPDATLHWFEKCGHFPHWDVPEEATELVLSATA